MIRLDDAVHVEHAALAVFGDVDLRRVRLRGGALRFLLQAAFFHVLGAVQHVGARHVMLARAHQRQLDLVLHVLDMEGAARWLAAHQGRDHAGGQLLNHVAHTCRFLTLVAVDGQKGLGHGDRNFRRLERHDRAVAADDAVVAERADDVPSGRLPAPFGATWIDGHVLSRLHLSSR